MIQPQQATSPPIVRDLLKRLSRRVVFRRRWPAEFGGGKLCVSPDTSFKVWYTPVHALDPDLFGVCRMLVGPGDRVWDLGANLGIFTFASAHRVGPDGSVTAVEADTWLVDLLRKSRQTRADGNRVRILPAAVTATVGVTEFNIARHGRAANFIGERSTVAGGIREKHQVVSVSLDWLLEHTGPPTVIKIDIEGMEIEALRGGRRLLEETRPRIYIEVDAPRQAEVSSLLRKLDYRFFSFRGCGTSGSDHLEERRTVDWNTVVLPAEQVTRFEPLVRSPAHA